MDNRPQKGAPSRAWARYEFTSAFLQLRVGTCSSISYFFLKDCFVFVFCFPQRWLPPKSVLAENVTKTIAFPRSSCLLTNEFFYFKYFSRGSLWRIIFWELFDAGTWQFHKKITNENTGKCWHTLRDWCFVINTEHLFWINDRIWYLINST